MARGAGRELVKHCHESEANKITKPAVVALKRAGMRVQVKSVVGVPSSEGRPYRG